MILTRFTEPRQKEKALKPLYIKVFKTFHLAPQTVIPLTGEMSRSDKRVIARNEQLEPVDGVKVQ